MARLGLVVGVAAGGLVLAAPAALFAQRPPGLPVLDQAVFDVIVEGEGDAGRNVSLDGQIGPCAISSRTRSSQIFEYGRGRGLRVAFVRLGRGRSSFVVMRRVGRPLFAPTVFNVRATTVNSAVGQAQRSGPPEVCLGTTDKVGDEPKCGRRAQAANYGLAYARGALTLDAVGDYLPPLPGSAPTECGQNTVETLSGPPDVGFESPPPLKGALKLRKVFGPSRAFVVNFPQVTRELRQESPIPSVAGAAVSEARHSAVVRFIRVGSP